jgi:hypothetical protein
VLTAKCSEVNVVAVGGGGDDGEDGGGGGGGGGEAREWALPEQFISRWSPAAGRFVTEPVSHSGG